MSRKKKNTSHHNFIKYMILLTKSVFYNLPSLSLSGAVLSTKCYCQGSNPRYISIGLSLQHIMPQVVTLISKNGGFQQALHNSIKFSHIFRNYTSIHAFRRRSQKITWNKWRQSSYIASVYLSLFALSSFRHLRDAS